MLISFFRGSHKRRNYFGEGIYGLILFPRGARFFSSATKTSLLLNYLNPLNFFVLFQNSQTFPFYGLTLGGSHSPGKAQCHKQINFPSNNCMMKAFLFSAVVWLWDRGSRGACPPATPLAFNITGSMVPLLPSATGSIHPFTHLKSGFQVLSSPKKPAQQLYPEMW